MKWKFMHFRVLIFVILATSRPQEKNTAKYQAHEKYYESIAEKGHRKERKTSDDWEEEKKL